MKTNTSFGGNNYAFGFFGKVLSNTLSKSLDRKKVLVTLRAHG